jgi:hypothetical protein
MTSWRGSKENEVAKPDNFDPAADLRPRNWAMRIAAIFSALVLMTLAPGSESAIAEPGLPAWAQQLGYRPTDLIAVRMGPAHVPLVQVEVSGVARWLLFDTGNMVGLSLTRQALNEQALPVDSTWRRLDSGGNVVGVFRRLQGSSVRAFGRQLGDLPVFETDDLNVPGLIGPDLLPGNRFTLDYRAGVLAVTNTELQNPPPEFTVVPLVRSSRHPRLILAFCTIAGRPVLTEFDTGKTRTVIDPGLAHELGLPSNDRGVRIESLAISKLTFAVPSAKPLVLAQIDPSLSTPIQLSVGSDVMSQLLITVDYAKDRLIMRSQPGS